MVLRKLENILGASAGIAREASVVRRDPATRRESDSSIPRGERMAATSRSISPAHDRSTRSCEHAKDLLARVLLV